MRKGSGLRPLTPYDFIFLIIPVAFFIGMPHSRGEIVDIYVDGKITYTLPLTQDTTITVDGKIGKSVIQIKDKKVRMQYSPCPLKICEKQGFISSPGREIICVPNRIVIRVRGKGLDGITE